MSSKQSQLSHNVTDAYAKSLRNSMHALTREALAKDEAVHEARKELKRARGALRLLRPVLTADLHDLQRGSIRKVAKALGGIRDVKVMRDALGHLAGQSLTPSERSHIRTLRMQLIKEGQRIRKSTLSGSRIAELRETLESALAAFSAGNSSSLNRTAITGELRKSYRKARRALHHAASTRNATALHEWRKRIKTLKQQLDMLDLTPRPRRRLGDLGELLGEDHDLWMLAARMRKASSPGTNALSRRIGERRQSLQREALRAGERVHRRRPRKFSDRIRRRISG